VKLDLRGVHRASGIPEMDGPRAPSVIIYQDG
jgi:hypothetical protein